MGDEAVCDADHGAALHCTRFAQIVGRVAQACLTQSAQPLMLYSSGL